MIVNLPSLRVILMVSNRKYAMVTIAHVDRSVQQLFSISLSLQYAAFYTAKGGTKYIIYRSTQKISVYTIPLDIPLHTGETQEVSVIRRLRGIS